MTDGLRVIGGFDQRYYTIINPAPIEHRSATDIISSMKDKLKEMEGGDINDGCI